MTWRLTDNGRSAPWKLNPVKMAILRTELQTNWEQAATLIKGARRLRAEAEFLRQWSGTPARVH